MKIIKIAFFLLGLIACVSSQAQTKHKLYWKVTKPTKVEVTIYQATVMQCDNSPCITASGYNICNNPFKKMGYEVIAVSQDFIKSNKLNYYQVVKLTRGKKTIKAVVVDCMNKRFINKVDILSHDLGFQGTWFLIPTLKYKTV